jgi:hypothetical protein
MDLYNLAEGTYVVRIWPSGTTTMGTAVPDVTHGCLFRAEEFYIGEGGVQAGYNYTMNSVKYKHRLATLIEIKIFHMHGTIIDSKQYIRDLSLDDLLQGE